MAWHQGSFIFLSCTSTPAGMTRDGQRETEESRRRKAPQTAASMRRSSILAQSSSAARRSARGHARRRAPCQRETGIGCATRPRATRTSWRRTARIEQTLRAKGARGTSARRTSSHSASRVTWPTTTAPRPAGCNDRFGAARRCAESRSMRKPIDTEGALSSFARRSARGAFVPARATSSRGLGFQRPRGAWRSARCVISITRLP